MIHPAGPDSLPEPRESPPPPPWEDSSPLAELACAVLWTTGPDPGRDGAFRLLALRRERNGSWRSFEATCDPFASLPGDARSGASARMRREFGVTGEELVSAERPAEAFAALADFLAGRPVVTLGARSLRAWLEHFGATGGHEGERGPGPFLDLSTIAGFLRPGRTAGAGDELPSKLLNTAPCNGPRAQTPARILDALGVVLGDTLDGEIHTLSLIAHSLVGLVHSFRRDQPAVANELRFTGLLLEHPSYLRREEESLYPAHRALDDGRLSDAVRLHDDLDEAAEAASPSWARKARTERRIESLPAFDDEEHTLDQDDQQLVEEIFQEHLPRIFAEREAGDATPSFRAGQYEVAREITERFGSHSLHLIHAPTGTGKTLAYLIPALLWAYRQGIRVGVATYTRALQEQAMERDVPVARESLRRAGLTGEPRIALLKGRTNYLCWRALRLQTPLPGKRTPPMELLAWTVVALFALTDADGDVDRLPRRVPLVDEGLGWRSALARLIRQVRAESGCCTFQEDRDACGADAARRRAERAHLVITNHAFALARREFFRHVVFDECEHLHDVAHSAFSRSVSMRALRDFFERMWDAGGAGNKPLNRIAAVAPSGTEVWDCTQRCIRAWEGSSAALVELERATLDFKLWREDVGGERQESDHHSLFREFVTEEDSDELLVAQGRLARAVNVLGAELAQMAEHLSALPTRGPNRVTGRLRRSLDLLRAELDEKLEAIEAWIPRAQNGALELRPQTFYDLEQTPRGDDVLAARVLLPHEYLGRHYYPDLQSATFVSATTWLKGGFTASATYLGLERAATPAEDEERLPSEVHGFRAPEAFDYSRVLVAVPRDAPSVRTGKQAYLGYVARFVAYLAERTRGRTLVLFTNADDLTRTAGMVEPFLARRRIPFFHQRMEDASKEELGELFRGTVDSVLFGLDTFWYGADFPGNTLEYLVIVRLPYGVPDRYHHAQCASLGAREQRRQVYMPRSLAKLRQGFGRLMRKEGDRGCVFILDARIVDPRHRSFLKELPLRTALEGEGGPDEDRLARFVNAPAESVFHEAFAHMGMLADIERRDLAQPFVGWSLERAERTRVERVQLSEDDLPF